MGNSPKYLTCLASGLIAAGLLAVASAAAADSGLAMKASSFIKETSAGNQGEIALAQLAQQKSQRPEIKSLAEMIQNDHQQSQEKLQTIAQAHGVTLDQGLTWSQKREQGKLEKLSGADFDQQYAKAMLEDHVNDLNKFQKAADQLQEADLKQFAQENITAMQKHLRHAEMAAKAVGVDQATISSITSKAPAMGGTSENPENGRGAGKQKGY
jgi:putative membrane protein